MSHYTTLATEFVSADHLARALHDLGFAEVEVHDSPQVLNGFYSRRNRAELIIRKESLGKACADLGFAKNARGRFDLVVDESDRRRFGPKFLSELAQRYAYHAAIDALREQDFELVQEEGRTGETIRLTLRRSTT